MRQPGARPRPARPGRRGHHGSPRVAGSGGQPGNAHCLFAPNGTEVRHFARTHSKRVTVPNDIHFVPGARLGYFGSIDERLDYTLIDALAAANQDWSIVMVGPVVGISPERLPRRANIFWIGKRPYGEMPDYAFGFQVCIAPFAVNDATRHQRPVKINEYVMAGRPVVCTDLPEVRRDFGELVSVADSTEEFIAACYRALGEPQRGHLEQGRRALAGTDWKRTAAAVERHIDEALARKEQNP